MPIPRVDPVADSPAKRMVMKFGMSPGGQWFLRHISPRVDPRLMRLTRGRVSSMGTFPRFVLLTCTGAKSGVRRTGCDNLTWPQADGLNWLHLWGRGCLVVTA